MARLTRVQQQARTRASVLAAAREEFVEHGYAPAKVDRIAERAELTRGAVYSNFPSKRALYLAVLVDTVESADPVAPAQPPASPADALGAFARAWLERLPLIDDPAAGGRLRLRSLVGVVDDEQGRVVLAQLARLEALLLGLALESCEPDDAAPRRVRLAELVLTLLNGSGLLAELAPGFGDPFDRTRACQYLAGLDLADTWAPPYLPYVAPAERCQERWAPPTGSRDQITGRPVDLGADGLVVALGARRLSAAEEAVRSARPGDLVTVVVVTGDPAETGSLVRLRVSDLTRCLRGVFPPGTWQRVRLVVDGAPAAAAMGLTGDDETEAAVRVRDGVIIARSRGRGAAYAAATAGAADRSRTREAGA
ncbi:TetR/AcrR family transcriptional regulator [Nonomuraea sp. SBT364]|uniref:TetR/AcrR family transcriptional regulator n=1 Tax=Nonomuraea sp. SBT364 TaxID=1580530 RepID=UPI00066E202C|nr:TetR/AcrR family transcriptional regulator [Nonomuraea sp. SBT364]